MTIETDIPNHKLLAQAFVDEGVDTVFGLMGDGNMYWVTSLVREFGVRAIHVRHENCAVAAADGYARATGRIGVASVTCGPGFTPITTALAVAAQRGVPMVVFAGDAPISDVYHLQSFDQRPVVERVGARFIPLRHSDRLLYDVREAFYIARHERIPVVLSVPIDLQFATAPWGVEYVTSADLVPRQQRTAPDPDIVVEAADMILGAKRPIVIAGEGALRSGAIGALTELADHVGALLATSLRAKGAFDGHPFNLDVAGAFSSPYAHELFAEADLVVAAGAALGRYTTEAGYLYPQAQVIQIDNRPRGLWQGNRTADLHVVADARTGVQSIAREVRARSESASGFRSEEIAERLAGDVQDEKEFQLEPGTLDPRSIVPELDAVVPKDWDIVLGCAHFFNFVGPVLRGRPPERYHMHTEMGAIGQALPAAIGVAAARGDGKVCLIEGEGSLLMQIQELETIARHGLKLLIVSFNDGAYGAEIHKLIPKGFSPDGAIFGRPNLVGVAQAFGLGGAVVNTLGDLGSRFETHQRGETASLWDLHVSRTVPSIQYRRIHGGEA